MLLYVSFFPEIVPTILSSHIWRRRARPVRSHSRPIGRTLKNENFKNKNFLLTISLKRAFPEVAGWATGGLGWGGVSGGEVTSIGV